MTEHEDIADRAERELERLRQHSAEVGEDIAFAKKTFVEPDEPPTKPLDENQSAA